MVEVFVHSCGKSTNEEYAQKLKTVCCILDYEMHERMNITIHPTLLFLRSWYNNVLEIIFPSYMVLIATIQILQQMQLINTDKMWCVFLCYAQMFSLPPSNLTWSLPNSKHLRVITKLKFYCSFILVII